MAQSPTAATPAPTDSEDEKRNQRFWIFIYNLAFVAGLGLVAAAYIQWGWAKNWPNVHLAVEATWFGALGGVMISLKGIYDHTTGPQGWNPDFLLWHLGRPISGAVAGVITVVLLYVLNGSVTGAATNAAGAAGDAAQGVAANGHAPAPLIVYATAFIFGTQERRFFGLLSEVARLIVHTPADSASPALELTGIRPAEADTGAVVVVEGHAIDPKATIKLGADALTSVTVASDGNSAAGIVPAHAAGTLDVTVTNPNGTSFVLTGRFTHL